MKFIRRLRALFWKEQFDQWRGSPKDGSARSALECGSSSYRFPPLVHTAKVEGMEGKAVAAATAVQGGLRTLHLR
jgi:hypothetical protein